MKQPPAWLTAVGKMLLYGITSALVLLAMAIALSGPSQQERRQTSRNVDLLVRESEKNRQLLCLAILFEVPEPPARVTQLCAEVGVGGS